MTPTPGKKKFSLGRWIKRGLLVLALIYLLMALLPYMLPPSSQPLMPDWQARQTSAENVNMADLLETGEEAMAARLKLIHQAKRSIRVASYIYAIDESGQTVSAALLAAADRGVQIQLLVDGLIGAVNLRNHPLAYVLGSHPNIELRFYNPVNLLNPEGLNARFHEKYFIVDDQWLVMGGRNVSNEFLTPSHHEQYNYDLDVLLWKADASAYDAVSQVSEYYNALWINAAPQFEAVPGYRAKAVGQQAEALRQKAMTLEAHYDLAALNLSAGLLPVEKTVFMVNPTRAGAKEPVLWKQLCDLMNQAERRLWILTPYLLMNDMMREDLAALTPPEDTKLLFNSRNSGNNLMASADFVFNRSMVLEVGMPVYEFQGAASLHAKSVLIDDNLSVFGSFNFDIRSVHISTETMLAVYSPELNAKLEAYMNELYGQSLLLDQSGYVPNPDVEPKEGDFWKTLCIYLLSPFVTLFRFLA